MIYLNRNNKSGVAGYEIYQDRIVVKFKKSAKLYTYSYKNAGVSNVEQMKLLARGGSGLNSFIDNYVRYRYDD